MLETARVSTAPTINENSLNSPIQNRNSPHSQSPNSKNENNQEEELPSATNYKITKTQKSSSFGLFPNEINWPKSLNDYDYSKRNLEWKYNKKPFRVSHKLVRDIESQFHPILQKFNDDNINNKIKSVEKKDLNDKLAEYYDYQLKNEQCYNIINLKDKLKGFENHPDYPKENFKLGKAVEKNKNNKRLYNVLSNFTCEEHHFDCPEKRPKFKEEDPNAIPKRKLININNYKEYDIITNNYKLFDNEKKQVDLNHARLKAAEQFYKTREFNCITGKFYDSERQKKYEDELKENNEKIRNRKRDEMFNPVNNIIYDKERLDSFDKNNQISQLKYRHRPSIENYYRKKEFEDDKKRENKLKNKLNYDRYKLQDERGYDLFTMKNTYNHYKNNASCSNKKNPWELLKEKSGENETFSKKEIYKSPYDITDVDKNDYEFKLKRENLLKNLPKIEDEVSFKRNPIGHKIKSRNISTSPNKEPGFMDKEVWFRSPRNLDMYSFHRRILTTQNL